MNRGVPMSELAVNGGAVTSFACSCSLNCFAATDRHAKCLIVVQIRAVQIFNYIIIETAGLDNLSVRIAGVPISEGPLYCTQLTINSEQSYGTTMKAHPSNSAPASTLVVYVAIL